MTQSAESVVHEHEDQYLPSFQATCLRHYIPYTFSSRVWKQEQNSSCTMICDNGVKSNNFYKAFTVFWDTRAGTHAFMYLRKGSSLMSSFFMQIANVAEQKREGGFVDNGDDKIWVPVSWCLMVAFFLSLSIKIWVQIQTFLSSGHLVLLYAL